MMTSKDDLIEIAARLASEDGENEEYDRALSELIADAFLQDETPLKAAAELVLTDIRLAQKRLYGGGPLASVADAGGYDC